MPAVLGNSVALLWFMFAFLYCSIVCLLFHAWCWCGCWCLGCLFACFVLIFGWVFVDLLVVFHLDAIMLYYLFEY